MKKLIIFLVISQIGVSENYMNVAGGGNQVDAICIRDLATTQKDLEQLKNDNRMLFNGYKKEKDENVSSASPLWYLLGGAIIGGAGAYFGTKR